MSDSSKEREVLMVMRKVLTSVIRDITPEPGMPYPLTKETVEDVRMCLGLITARERELADAAGAAVEKPYYVDEKPKAEVVPMASIGRPRSSDGEEE
ncbi:MAG TPA: segregation and condensation protein A [Sedimenticola thiotaurini]|uniref:Segregation and condensation protein A n=1 Tax=Sedimenticola thiotaurini TaxID=1543721 RepID=A0A831W8P2_9GAMM|nr:segregation and condensation protein A [Sedimenticola thiotaurini]